MKLNVEPVYTLVLNPEEMRIIGRALAGVPLKGKEQILAREMNVRMMESRYQQLGEKCELSERALAKARGALMRARDEPVALEPQTNTSEEDTE